MDTHTFPASLGLYLAELVKRWGVSTRDLLEGTGVEPEVLTDLRSRFSSAQVVTVLERARLLTGEPALGLYLGRQLPASALGRLGLAILSASTVREAVDLAIEFIPIVTTALGLRLRVERQEASILV